MHRANFEAATEDYVQRVRGFIRELNRQGLRLTWLSEHLDIVVLKWQYMEANRWKHILEVRLKNTIEEFQRGYVNMVTSVEE